MNESLVDEVRNARFTPVRGHGYDTGEVDGFLDDLVGRLTMGQEVADFVAGARFTTVRFREGYAMADVDALLDRIVEQARSAGSAAPPEVSDEAPSPGRGEERIDAAPVNRPTDAPTTITDPQWVNPVAEVRSPLARLFRRKRP